MVKKLLICFFTTFFTYPIFASPIEKVYEEVIVGAENYRYIEALLNIQNELSGFIFTDSVNSRIIYDDFDSDEYLVIDIGGKIFKTIHTISSNHDSVFIYTLDVTWSRQPRLHKIVITRNTFTREELLVPVNSEYMADIAHADFHLFDNLLTIEFSFLINSGTLPYYSIDIVSKSFFVSTESFLITESFDDTSVRQGSLTSQFSVDRCYLNNVSSSGHSPYWGYYNYAYSSFFVLNEFDFSLANAVTDINAIYSFHVENFAPSSACDELLIHARAVDLMGYYPEKTTYLGCYSFENGIPDELWYNDRIGELQLAYIYKQKDLLIGFRNDQTIISIDYLNGKLYDSTSLDRKLQYINFYEEGFSGELLHMIGFSSDTLFAYRFDTPTSVHSILTPPHELPATFSLLQNHPNPFNGETRIEFYNEETQFLTLRIYNILGQEIKSLAAGNLGTGNHSFYWDGHDEYGFNQSTGVYFARLESDKSSQMIKLIYLK